MKYNCFILLFLLQQAFGSLENRALTTFINIESHGKGNQEAVKIMDSIDELGPKSILPLLKGMNEANPIGDNWIKGAIIKILSSCEDSDFPSLEIRNFIQNRQNIGSSRRNAFELLQDYRPKLAASMIPQMLDDPEPSLRREAVARLLESASQAKEERESVRMYKRVVLEATDAEQIKTASNALKQKGEEIDLVKLMGFLTEWDMIGPFDNLERQGFYQDYGPELGLQNQYMGKDGKVKWSPFSTADPFGMLDINQKFGAIKEVLAYAKSDFFSENEQDIQIRFGSKNAWKIWLNQKLIFARDEYHRGGTRIDQFILDGKLKKGRNLILVKICQNEQTQSWTKQWEFCLRITDRAGKAIQSSKKTFTR